MEGASVGKMQAESLSLFQALLLAFAVSALGLVTQVIFRWYEGKQRARQALIDRVYAELAVAEGVMYRVRIALAKTAAKKRKPTRFEAEEYIFGPVIPESRITSLELDLKQKSINATKFVVAIHTHRESCIDFLSQHEPRDIELTKAFLEPMINEWSKLKKSADCVIKEISDL
jgi:hypothetical protein